MVIRDFFSAAAPSGVNVDDPIAVTVLLVWSYSDRYDFSKESARRRFVSMQGGEL